MPVLALPILGRTHDRQPTSRGSTIRRRRAGVGGGSRRGQCPKCNEVGHNRRTCSFEPGQDVPAEEGAPIASEKLVHSPMDSESVDVEDGGNVEAISQVLTPGAPNSTQQTYNGVPEYPESSEDEASDNEGPHTANVDPRQPPLLAMLQTWATAEDIDAFLEDFTSSLPPLDATVL